MRYSLPVTFGRGATKILRKLTAGLLVFLFLISPLASIRAEENGEVPLEEPVQTEVQVEELVESEAVPSEDTTEPQTGEAEEPQVEQSPELATGNEDKKVENKLNLGVDSVNNFGALHFNFPIVVPDGRNGQKPNIDLVYDSQSGRINDIFGFGWSLSIPSIERINQKGIETLYTNNDIFNSSFDGEIIKVNPENNEWYGAKSESGQFLTYQFVNGQSWLVTDKQGTKYAFGSSADARQDDSANTSRIFKWMLEESIDTNGNKIKYEYFKDQGQIYPFKITYSNVGQTAGIFEINFTHLPRPDQVVTKNLDFSVKTAYRINEIDIKTNNVWTKKYTLSYVTGDNNQKSLLNTIIESGQTENGENPFSLPATTFSYQSSAQGWALSSSRHVPIGFNTTHKFVDVNGDSLSDIIAYTPSANHVYINSGNDWQVDPNFQLPVISDIFSSNIQWADVNGDAFTDILDGGELSGGKVYFNNADGTGWTLYQGNNWKVPLNFSTTNEAVMDINGDNLADIIYNCPGCSVENRFQVHLNNGQGWSINSNWNLPNDAFDQLSRFGDINGDGLIDIIHLIGYQSGELARIYINNGHTGWIPDSTWNTPEQFQNDSVVADDINQDGLMDLLIFRNSWQSPQRRAFINNGNGGWVYNSAWELPSEIFSTNTTYLSDVNGDGLLDIVNSDNNPVDSRVYIANGEKTELLNTITSSEGGTTNISYKGSPEYVNNNTLSNPLLPVNLQTVSLITENPLLGASTNTTFSYSNGFYYHNPNAIFDKKLAGFGEVISNDDLSSVKTYYHQGNGSNSGIGEYEDDVSKLGRAYRKEIKNSTATSTYAININKWDKTGLDNGRRSFVKLVDSLQMSYDGDSDHKDKAQRFEYDNTNGNQTIITELGEVNGLDNGSFTDTGADTFTTTISYVSNANGIVGLPAVELTNDNNSVKVKETKHYYDNLALGQVDKGNETKTQIWRAGSKYIDVEKTYNSYGLVISEKDPRDKVTTYSYDSYNLYPVSVTNALNHTTGYSYDYSSGQVKQTTDPNNRIFLNTYDGLDRVIEEKQPDVSNPNTSVKRTTYFYALDLRSIVQNDYLDASNMVSTYTYVDGFGRKIQERREAESSGAFNVRDFIYTQGDLILKESLPYISSGLARTEPITTSTLLSEYTYDPMQRAINVHTAVGDTSNVYDDWKTTITDAKGKVKNIYKDAYDNLVRVDEHNGSSVYTTQYQWNGLKKLTKITDALSNERNFLYDGLGRVTSAEDLHAWYDGAYGTWTYTYDASGNLVSRLDPNGVTVAYSYDDINRITTEDAYNDSDPEVVYTYDSCTEGIGRLCGVTNDAVQSTVSYDALGRISSEEKVIDRQSYISQYSYDRQGNKTFITNPDNSQFKYFYNAAGLVDKVQQKESSAPGFSDVLSNIDYNAVSLPTTVAYANGAVTTNIYDSQELYRLRTKVTVANGQNVQALTYTYDPVGNILQIVDASTTLTAKTTDYTYDDLHRLLTATITNSAAENVDGPDNGNQVQTFSYDAIGNILTKSDVGSYSYDGASGVANFANPHAVTSTPINWFSYDNNGNMIEANAWTPNDYKAFTWDYNNRLISATAGASTSNYTYDASGQRVKSITPSGTTVSVTNEFTVTPDGTEKHVFLGDTAIATISTANESLSIYNIHADHLTGSNVITDHDENIDELTDYYAFGTMRIDEQNGEHAEKRKFTGHEYDVDTGLTYAGARYYDAALGRWLSQDPVFLSAMDPESVQEATQMTQDNYFGSPQTMNAYTYVANNPLKYKDYKGEFLDTVVDIGFIAYDTYKLVQAMNNGGNVKAEWTALGLDAAGALIPGVTGLGMVSRAAKVADKAVDVAKATEKVADVARVEKSVNAISDPARMLSAPTETKLLPNHRQSLIQNSPDQKFTNIVKNNYRPKSTFGDGSTAAAARHELLGGSKVGGRDHVKSSYGYIQGYHNMFKSNPMTKHNPYVIREYNKLINSITR